MKVPKFIILIFLLFTFHLFSSGHNDVKYIAKHKELSGNSGKPMRTMLNVNDFTIWHWASGTSGLSANGMDPGGIFPRGTAPVIFTDGLIWGGFVNDTDMPLRVGGVTYREGIRPGRILPSGQAQDPNHSEVRIYRIHKNYRQLSKDQLRRDAAELLFKDESEVSEAEIDSVYRQYETDWLEWPAHLGAPFYDLNGNGIYEPKSGENPGLHNADQVIWYVCNDLENASAVLFGSPTIGLELQVTAWAYSSPDPAVNAALFRKNRLINKGSYVVDSMFVGLFSDPDVGKYTDDLAGCDSLLSLAYAYSSTGQDWDFIPFNMYSPAIGYIFLGDRINQATSFGYFSPGANYDGVLGDYDGTFMMYNWLNGFIYYSDSNSQPYRYQSGPDKGKVTKFPLSGDPVSGTGDIDGQEDNIRPGDRRILLSNGPLIFHSGDTLDVIDARIGGYGTPYHPYAVEWLKINTKQIKTLYPNFASYTDIWAPEPKAVAANGRIQIDWGSDQDLSTQIEKKTIGHHFKFEGYNIWQLPRANAPVEEGIKIATFDLASPPRLIMGYDYDPAAGVLINRPLAYGHDTGIQRFLTISRDSLNHKNLIDGQPYHFAVTAYYYCDIEDLPFPFIESDPGYITIHAQASDPGYSVQSGDTLSVTRTGKSHGKVTPIVVNPAALTGHTYQVSFPDPAHWTLTDITDGVVKITNQTNLSGDYNYPTIDGIIPIVTGPEYTRLTGWDYTLGRWFSGYNWGGQEFYGGLDTGHRFFGSTMDTFDLVPVRLEFQDQAGVDSAGFISTGAIYRQDQDYAWAGSGQLPFAAYDIIDPDQPRRLNICFVESDSADGAAANGIWDMGWDGRRFPGEDGAHEYIFIMNSSYDEGQNYNDVNNGTRSDVLFAIWPKNRGTHSYLDAEFTMDIEADVANSPEDIFTYSTPASAAVPNRFRVYHNYPNPFNSGTTIRYWLPAQNRTTLEIYDIRGRRVATPVNQIQDQGEYYFNWQPGNIASGIYFCRLTSGPYSHLMKITYLK